MPLVKKPSGWFWGSKGPFNSKAKALAVARAAYAAGYKGESDTSVVSVTEHQKKIQFQHCFAQKLQANVKIFTLRSCR